MSKTKLRLVEPSEKVIPSFTLGDRAFPVVSLENLDNSYDKITEYMLLVAPILARLMSMESAAQSLSFGMGDTAELIVKLDLEGSIKDLSAVIPTLVAFSCQTTDPNVTADEVKRLSKKPSNPNLFKAIAFQISVDNLMQDFSEIKDSISVISGKQL